MSITIQKGSSAKWEMFGELRPELSIIFFDIALQCENKGIQVEITSMIRPKIPGVDTGIHSSFRALDFIIHAKDQQQSISWLLSYVNDKYKYGNGKYKTLIYHKANGTGSFKNFHFHLQVAA